MALPVGRAAPPSHRDPGCVTVALRASGAHDRVGRERVSSAIGTTEVAGRQDAGGARRSLEDVIEQTCTSPPPWARQFTNHRPPCLHLPPAEYRRSAERCGLQADRVDVTREAWDFDSRAASADVCDVTFVEWAQKLPAGERPAFIADVLDRYGRLGDGSAGDAAVVHFHQMRIALRRA